MPGWLEALEQEVDRVLSDGPEEEDLPDPQLPVLQVRLTREEVRRQVQGVGRFGLAGEERERRARELYFSRSDVGDFILARSRRGEADLCLARRSRFDMLVSVVAASRIVTGGTVRAT